MRIFTAWLSLALITGVFVPSARAQEPLIGTASYSLQESPVLDQNSPIYKALQTVHHTLNPTMVNGVRVNELPARLTRTEAAGYLVRYIYQFYIETSTANFTTLWQTQPETFNALRTLATELGAEATPQNGVTAQMVANVARGPFPDVPRNHWAAGAVERLRVHGIVVGYPNGAYAGQNK